MTPGRISKMQQLRELILAATLLLCFWILLVTAWRTTLHPLPRSIRYEKQTLECGNTTVEAESRGCAFDMLSHNVNTRLPFCSLAFTIKLPGSQLPT